MSRKVKCIECEHCTRFAIPVTVTKNNVGYVKGLLNFYKIDTKIVCDRIEKTKPENNEQYCNHFKKGSEDIQKINTILFKKEFQELKEKYKKYIEENGEPLCLI